MNIVELIKAHISLDLILKASKFLGESENDTAKGFEIAVPALLASILNAANNKEKIANIWDLIQHKENDPVLLNHLDTLFEDNSKESSNTSIGASLLSELYGGKHIILNSVTDLSGFQKTNSAGKVMSITAPLVLAFLRNKVQISELGMAGLMRGLIENKESILGSLPSGWPSQIGLMHLMFTKEENMQTDSEGNTMVNRYWWIWLIGLIALIFGLWTCVKSCNQTEVADKINTAIKNATTVIDSTSNKVVKTAREKLDSIELELKSKWEDLGEYINVRLGQYYVSLPEKGIELKLLQWLEDKTRIVDKTTWFNFDRIIFEPGSASLFKISQEQINNIATIMNVMQSVEIKIGGYTDNTGDPVANMKLSLARAEAVKKALVDAGIDPKRMEAEGYGQEHPSGDNTTEGGREQNRRVAIRVTKK